MDFDIVGVAEHHLDVPSAAEEAGRLRMEGIVRSGHLPMLQAVEELVGEPWQ